MEDTEIKIEPDLTPSSDPLLFDDAAAIKDPLPEESESLKSFCVPPKESLKNVRIFKPSDNYDGENFFVASGIVGKPSENNSVSIMPPEIYTETAEFTEDNHHYDLNGNTDVSIN